MTDEPKKISLAEAMKQKLAQKKQDQSKEKNHPKKPAGSTPVMKSQQTKKANNQSRRTGV
jgi:hypothetical protein